MRNRDRRLARMKKQLDVLTSENGVELEPEIHDELSEVVEKHDVEMMSLPGSDFRRIFWSQQVYYVWTYNTV